MTGMMDRCMEAMGSTSGMMGMDGGTMSGLLFVALLLLFLWVLGLALVGALGVWVFRRLREQG